MLDTEGLSYEQNKCMISYEACMEFHLSYGHVIGDTRHENNESGNNGQKCLIDFSQYFFCQNTKNVNRLMILVREGMFQFLVPVCFLFSIVIKRITYWLSCLQEEIMAV